MAISTYTQLQTALENWLHRSDLDSVIPDFITLGEADFNRRIRIAEMEVRASATFNEGYEDVPTDFLEMREIKVNSSPPRSLKYMTPQQMTEFYPTLVSGDPDFYTLVDHTLRLNKTPTSEVEIAYYVRIPALSDAAPTNWLLTNHPDVYLYGSLVHAEGYIKNDKRLPMWKSLYEVALTQVAAEDERARWSGGPLQMRVSWQ